MQGYKFILNPDFIGDFLDLSIFNMDKAGGLNVMTLNDTKAGMEGLDKEKINAIIEEASKGSKFYEAKAKSQQRIDQQVQKMQKSLSNLTTTSVNRAASEMDALATKLRQDRDLSRTIVHVDMDAFYAAVEMRDDPSLRDVPMAVGGMGMLSTSNYLARKFGVRAGMPGFIGKKLCPQLVLVKLNFDKYRAVSSVIREVFREYDPNFIPMSLDEAYLDITEYLLRFPHKTAESTTQEIREKITLKTNLTASAGIACNTLLAKICSDQNKPNGQFYLAPDEQEIMKFIRKLSIRKVNGIGNVTEQMLRSIGVTNCQDLYDKRGEIKLLFSSISSNSFLRISLGIGSTSLADWAERERKSLSNETTFRDTSDTNELMQICEKLSLDLAKDLESEGLEGRSVSLKIKTHKFNIKTKVHNLLGYTNEVSIIATSAKSILRHFIKVSEEKPLKLRLMGVRMSDFKSDAPDEAKNEGGRQTRMDSFLRNESASVSELTYQAYTCPICNMNVRAANENAFNVHLDSCLNNDERKSKRPAEKSGECASSYENVEAKPKRIRLSVEGHMHDGETSSTCTAEVNSKSQNVETSYIATCPVCSKNLSNPSDLLTVNKHIDECLKVNLNSNQKGSNANQVKTKSRGIKNFFNVITPNS